MSDLQIDEKTARISDILEQIERLNQMVDFHKNESGEESMMRQYEDMRNEFLRELETLLSSFKINVQIKDIAV
ncbi:hypothetical protein [Catalinimonas niigatensis]|uniref:hypothetical protein n=1 Tax=Catalinimonas niigatensis TaxID=1397264 RepID=UPI002664F2A9|nr:hypothetical protein [Catalinimonas niigatensis]WPP52169.1 hypothetical protein PZB72_07225 [Catalinimonas niigatensis]